tara:strand:- start:591 stop:5069 length:4479 start_codon:yes stop_codon:yes gene_type:complete
MEKSLSSLDKGFDQATAKSAKLAAQQKKTTSELAKAAKAQSTLSKDFIGPSRVPLDNKGIQNVNRAMLTSRSLAKETRVQEERRVVANLKSAQAIKKQNSALKTTEASTKKVANNTDSIKRAIDNPSLRYALYDIGNSFRRVAAAALAISATPIVFGIKYERDFANVIRTNELAVDSIAPVRESLLEIARTTPISWKDITAIAALAGQLNIAEETLANFTETTAKIAATTNLSVDAAGTALGRLDQLIEGVDGNFEALGSAILAVGVSSVSTESQIVNVAQNIASMGNLAGLTASDVVGLSGAIASLGIRPELARGNVTRLFSRIGAAVAESGKKLDEFGRLTGRTAEEFAGAWSSEPTEVLLDFFEGINNEGPKAERTLRDIGITSVRDIPAILRLAQSQDEVRRLVALSNEEFLLGTKINEQYAVIAETTSEQIKRLGQNFEVLAATVGESTLVFAPLIGGLNSIVEVLSRFAATTAGQFLGGLTIALGLFVAGIAGTGAVLATAIAGMIALSFAAKQANISLSSLTISSILSGKAFQTFAVALLGANNGLTRMAATAKVATLAIGGILAVVTLAAFAWETYSARQREADEMQSQLFGNLAGYTDALIADGKAVEAGAKAYKSWTPEIKDNTDERILSLRAAEEGLGLNKEEKDSIGDVTDALEAQTYAIGENVKERIRAQALEIPGVADLFGTDEVFSAITEIVGTEDPFAAIFEAVATNAGDVVADQILAVLKSRETGILAEIDKFVLNKETVPQELLDRLDAAADATILFKNEGVALFDSMDGGLVSLAKTSIAADRVGEGMRNAGTEVALTDQKLREITKDLFGAENAMKKTQDAAQEFGKAIFDSGADLDITNEALQNFVKGVVEDPFSTSAEKIAILNGVLGLLQENNIASAVTTSILDTAMKSLGTGSGLVKEDLSNFNEVLAEIAGTLDISGVLDAMGIGLGGVGSSANSAAKDVKTLSEQFNELVDSMFESTNIAQSAARSIADLGKAYGDLGADAFYASSEIQDAVGNILDASSSPEEGVANLNALYAQLASTVGSDTAPSLQFLRNTINQVASSFNVAADAVAGATVDLDFFNMGVEQTQKEVSTLSDYAGDLENVISRAFDIRYASTFEIDRIAEAWFKLTGQVEDANKQIEDLIVTQEGLSADRSLKEYFLSIADAYGDTLRAGILREELSALNKEQENNAKAIAEAQAIAGGDLTGQGPGQRQNRSALLGLVGDYQGYITTLAESGANQDELRKATERARKEFIAQALELGYQEDVVLQYAQAFDDVKTAIDRVPRNITVDANTNPAIQALNELNAKLTDSINLAARLNQITNQGITSADLPGETIVERTPLTSSIDSSYLPFFSGVVRDIEESALNRARRTFGFASGGYTGSGGKYQPAGVVHRGEYVVPSQYVNQSSGLPNANFLSQLQNGMPGYANGGFVGGGMGDGTMMVELSPFDRKLLSDAGNVQLRVDGKVVASATNRSNFNEARRGSN